MLKCDAVSFAHGEQKKIYINFENVNIHVKRGEIVALLGASGIGKSTLARILAGLQKPDKGSVTCDDVNVVQPFTPVALVFQDYKNAVFPWLSVKQNMELGLSKPNSAGHGYMSLESASILLGIQDLLGKYPHELSGGQVQRVQLGRALVSGVDFLVLDEPDTSLDMEFKKQFIEILIKLVEKHSIGVFLVTHSIDRAVQICQRGYILRKKTQQNIEILQFEGYNKQIDFSKVMESEKFKEVYRCIYESPFH